MKDQAQRMQDYLESPFHSDDEEQIITRLEFLSILNSKAGKLQADCQQAKDIAIMEATKGVLSDPTMAGQSTSILKQYIDAKAHEHTYLVKWFERIGSSAVHQIDALRSILSYRKQTMQL